MTFMHVSESEVKMREPIASDESEIIVNEERSNRAIAIYSRK